MTEPENSTPSQPTKEQLIADISKTISDRRKLRNLTLDKVFQNIKIRIPYLEAIENGRWDQLPGDVFIRSFIKRYADHLGLDGEKLLAPYFSLVRGPEKKNPNVPQIFKGNEISRFQLIAMAMAGIVVIVLIKLIGQESTSSIPIPVSNSPVSASTAVVAGVEAPAANAVVSGAHQLHVFSPNPLWLRITAQDKNFEGFIPQSATWTWKAEGHFSVRLGHTKDVVILFDNRPVIIEDNQKRLELPAS